VARSELTRRVLFSVAAIPVVFAAAFVGDAFLAGLLAVVTALAAWEFFRIARAAGYEPFSDLGVAIAAAVPLTLHAKYLGLAAPTLTWGVILALGAFAAAVARRPPQRRPLAAAAVTVFGIVYTGGALSYAYALRYHDYAVGALAGTTLLVFPLLITWTTDTGAYVVGKALGRHRLHPGVSPGKTVEGAVGALLLSVVLSWLYVRSVLAPHAQLALAPWATLLFGAAVSVAVQTGDLAESLIKREAGVKDSSHLIPGHGGVLDRIDGLIFALPVGYWLLGTLRLVPVPSVR
jgi:phosphatidate cytidylyltransferase